MQSTRSIHDVVDRFRTNWPGYVAQYRVSLGLTLLAGFADMASTMYFMASEGPQAEVHPGVRAVCVVFGPVLGPVVGKLGQFAAILAVTVWFRRQAIYVFIPVIVLYAWAAWYNVWGCHLYYPRLLRLLEFLPGG